MTVRLGFLLFWSVVALVENATGTQKSLWVRQGWERCVSLGTQHLSPCSQSTQFSKRKFYNPYDFSNTYNIESGQVFCRPTYECIAKEILCKDESIRIDILKAFTGIESISSARQLDQDFEISDSLKTLSNPIKASTFKSLFKKIKESGDGRLYLNNMKARSAYKRLKEFSNLYDDLIPSFPAFRKSRYRSTVDFHCETEVGEVTITFRVGQPNLWDKRALAYVAEIYGNQLEQSNDYAAIREVIGVYLLGDGDTAYWHERGKFMRKYVVRDEYDHENTIPSLRLFQYSLGDVNLNHPDLQKNERLKQWLDFFKSAHEKQSIPDELSEPVKKAYDMMRIDTLKKVYPDFLRTPAEYFATLTEHDNDVREEGLRLGEQRALKAIAKKMKENNKSLQEIIKFTGLSEEEIKKL